MKKFTKHLFVVASLLLLGNLSAFAQAISFNAANNQGCMPFTATFMNTTTDQNAFRYEWNFGDGSSLTDTLPQTLTHTFTNSGYYNVSVAVYDANNTFLGNAYLNNSIQVQGPQLNIPDSICPGDMVSFCVNGNFNSVSFNYGDGATGNQNCDQHGYSSTGIKTVTATVSTTDCGVVVLTKTIVVGTNIHPHPYINTNTTSTCLGASINFGTSGYSGYQWSFGDGSPNDNTQNPSHIYTTPGQYMVHLIVMNGCNKYGVDSTLITITTSPTPWPTGSWFNINTSQTVSCPNSNLSFSAPSGYNSYVWNFGDGSGLVTTTNNYVYHTFGNISGLDTVKVKITSACGNDTTLMASVNFTTGAPFTSQNGFNFTNSSPICPNSGVNFNAPSGFNSYQWNFGDGSALQTSNQDNAYHNYGSGSGPYTASVKVTNGCGHDTTLYSTVTISSQMVWPTGTWFNVGNSSPACPGSYVGFNAPSGFNNYQWNYGDGSALETTNNNSSNHQYPSTAGTYTVSIKITSSCGNDTTLHSIVIINNNAPWPNGNWFNLGNSSPVCPNSSVGFNAPGGYSSYQWNFGDGSPLVFTNNSNTQHSYTGGQTTYNASVKILNGCGHDTTLYSVVTISTNAPFPTGSWFNLSANPDPVCPNSNVNLNAPQGYQNYTWNFGDNTPIVTTTSYYFNHIYGNDTGSYNASVKIVNTCGHDTTLYTVVHVQNGVGFPQNQSGFKVEHSIDPICSNDYVGFRAPGGYNSYEWNFGDNTGLTTTSDYNNYHKYTGTGPVYYVSVKITNSCGLDTLLHDSIHISGSAGFPNYPDFRLEASLTEACPNANVGFQAPGGFSSYKWNFGDDTTHIVSTNNQYSHTYGSALGVYTASVKVTNGCGHDTTLYLTITISSNVGFMGGNNFITQSNPNPACVMDFVTFEAPYGYNNYKWTFGDGDSTITAQRYAQHKYTTAGTYSYSVKITNTCGRDTTLYGTTQIGSGGTFNNYMSIQTNGGSACPNDLVNFKLSESGYSQYLWNFGDGDTLTAHGDQIQHAFHNAGIYNVSCKVINGCGDTATSYVSFQVVNNSPVNPNLSIMGNPNPACPGDQVFFIINSGQPTTQYIWNFGDNSPADTTIGTGPAHVYTTVGTYTVTVLATNSCGMTRTVTFTETIGGGNPPSLVANDGSKNWGFPGSDGGNSAAGCAGDAVVFYFMGDAANNVYDFGDGNTGTATEHMVISGGDGSFPVTIIKHVFTANGPYMIHLKLTNGCGLSTTDSMMINIGGTQSVNGDLTTSPAPFTTCAPVSFIAFGGASYVWNFGDGGTLTSSSPTVSHTYANQGVYVASVLVTNGCGNTATYSKPINVTGVGGPAIAVTTNNSPTCSGGNNGSVTIAANGGQTPYTYLWNDANAQTAATATGLASGTYSVTVTDNIGCASVLAVSVTGATPIVLNSTTTASACSSITGSATVSVTSGGTGTFTYAWSTGATTASVSNLAYGTYTVTVTDANNCATSKIVNVSEANAPTVTLDAVTNATCSGSSNGGVNISVTGGSNYTYTWSNGATTQDISGVMAGNYSVTVSSGGCNSAFSATVTEAVALQLTGTSVQSPTCGNFDGEAGVSVVGGSTPYMYQWNSDAGSQTTATATGLPAGTYAVTVTDNNGCMDSTTVSLSNSNAPNITEVISEISCHGDHDGAINITVTGGTSPYLYTWNVAPPQTNHQDLDSLTAGNYLVFVHDAQGCISVRSYTLVDPSMLMVAATSVGASCNVNDGEGMATVTGGTAPYTYSWTGGQTAAQAIGLSLGNYNVSVTDNHGCMALDSVEVTAMTVTPSICMVTVDSGSVNNHIIWDKTMYTSVDSFFVYREVSTNNYVQIGAQAYSELSMFIDTVRSVGPANGDPNVGTYRYKMSLRDACGSHSSMSPYHNTVYVVNNSGSFTWNKYEVEGITTPLANQYILICDTAHLDAWFTRGSVAGTQTTVADPDFATLNLITTAEWRVKTDWAITCSPTRAAISTSRSNKKQSNGFIINGVNSLSIDELLMKVYPNPANDNVTIELAPSDKNVQLKIVNVVGQLVYNETIVANSIKTVKNLNVVTYPKGIYYVVLETNKKITTKKLVID